MQTAKDYITGFNIVSDNRAIQLKLSHIQVTILNLFIMNWLANKLEKYDECNPACQLFRFNTYHWAKYFECDYKYVKRSLIALTKPITDLDGMQIQIMYRNKIHKYYYVGMELSIIHKLVDKNLFNIQCNFHEKQELKCLITNNKEDDMHQNNKEPLFLVENKTEIWAENIIKKICNMSSECGAQININGKSLNVFPHLKNDEFKTNRNGIDDTVKIINDIYSGQFFREYKRHTLFGNIKKEYLEFKNVEPAIDKLLFLSRNRNKAGIETFLLRCARNYFEALKPGMETHHKIKAAFPVNIKSFFLHINRDGTFVANFLMFYSSTLSEKDLQLNRAVIKVKNIVPESVFDRLLDYETYVLENQIFSFWLNVKKLTLKIQSIIKNKKTSYSMASCFDIVFDRVTKIAEHHKKVLPGYFDCYNGQTASDAINEIQDK